MHLQAKVLMKQDDHEEIVCRHNLVTVHLKF